jgi:hypothetical protein
MIFSLSRDLIEEKNINILEFMRKKIFYWNITFLIIIKMIKNN